MAAETDLYAREIASAIVVRHIQTAIEGARVAMPGDEQAAVRKALLSAQLDAAPVIADNVVAGWVRRSDLSVEGSSLVKEVMQPLTGAVLVDASAPLSQLLKRFLDNPFLLVVDGDGVCGLVTPSDLNKQAGRTDLFLQLAGLELALADLLRRSGVNDKILLVQLPSNSRRKVLDRLEKQRVRDEIADFTATLDLKDLLLLAPKEVHEGPAWKELDGENGEKTRQELVEYRNTVIHAVLHVVTDDPMDLHHLYRSTELVNELMVPIHLALSGTR